DGTGRSVVGKRDEDDLVYLSRRSIPRTMQRDKQPSAIWLVYLRARVVTQTQSRGMRRNQNIRNNRARDKVCLLVRNSSVDVIANVGIRPTVESTVFHRSCVVRNEFVTEAIALVDRRPDCIGAGLQRQTHGIANSGS